MKKRHGISTIVGSMFFIIVFTTVAGYVVFSMNQLDKFSETIISKSQEDRDRQQEEFKITSVTKDNNKFNISVQNTGQIPINLTRLWVQNKTDPTWPVSKYYINKIVAPGQTISAIGQTLPVVAKPTQAYDLTIATQRGNTNEVMVNSASTKPIDLQLFVLPETVPTGFTTTLLFGVTNNMSSIVALTNLVPNLSITPYGGTATLVSGPEPLNYKFLDKGDTAYFKWVYIITGTSGQRVNFQASLQNGYLGNSVSKNVTINQPQINFTVSSNKTGTTTYTMLGDGVTLTPQVTGRIEVSVSGYGTQNIAADGGAVQIRQVTGGCPANAAAVTGTTLGNTVKMTMSATTTKVPFAITVQTTGLTINQKYCFELTQQAITGGTFTVLNVMWSAKEI